MESEIDLVSLSRVKKIIESVEKKYSSTDSDNQAEVMLSFEFIIGSCFPAAYQNMQDVLKKAHMDGYRQCLLEHENEVDHETKGND